jgi:hypothetical protein
VKNLDVRELVGTTGGIETNNLTGIIALAVKFVGFLGMTKAKIAVGAKLEVFNTGKNFGNALGVKFEAFYLMKKLRKCLGGLNFRLLIH